jgi:hypothetical protein
VATLSIPRVLFGCEPFSEELQVHISRAERFGAGSSYAYTSLFARPDEQGALRVELPLMDPFTPYALTAMAREGDQGLWVTLARDLTGARREFHGGALYLGSNDFLVAQALVLPGQEGLEQGPTPYLVTGDAMQLRPLERLFTIRAPHATETSGRLHWSRNKPEKSYDHDHWEWSSAPIPTAADVEVFGTDTSASWLLVATGENGALSKPVVATYDTEVQIPLIDTGALSINTSSGSDDERYYFVLTAMDAYPPPESRTDHPAMFHRAVVGEGHGDFKIVGRSSRSRSFFVGDYKLEQWKRTDLRAGLVDPYRVQDIRITAGETVRVSAP